MAAHTVDNPFTGETACSVPLADEATIGKTLDRAREAAKALRRTSVEERIAICDRALVAFEAKTEEIARDITQMMGKPLSQARGEVKGMAGRWRHMQEIAKESLADIVLPAKDNFDRRIAKEPLGVVLDLPAWNYPLLTAVNAVIPAVLAGNAVVLKHSPRTPLCGDHFARAFQAAGGPPDVVQTLFVDYATTEKMVGDPRIDHVLFTGSVLGGHKIAAAAKDRFMHVGLELGGNDPAYVAEDADLLKTVENVVDGAIYNAGQSCCAVERVYVHQARYADFLAAAEPLVRAYVLGDPMDDKTSLGPIAQPWHPKELADMVGDAKAKGAKLVVGGEACAVNGKGRFFQATFLRDVPQSAELMQKESFGPILAVSVVASDEEALARMNDSRLGLTASVWTKDKERAERLARQLDFGTVYMNRCDALDPALPWTGVKDSGRGVTLSALGFDALTRPKAIHFRLAL
ncbi:MAG: aldehyde dehydrogenase family protein [Deltaproteobacteria bacterium]|nr:aldehyde dehydrogenase family protein [Deltaproteobacteria bacterium]